MSEQVTHEIKDGIEWFDLGRTRPDGTIVTDWDCQCARCGSSCDLEDCDRCAGSGEIECEPDREDFNPVLDWETCPNCEGRGGWWRCLSSRKYCESHPLPGREDIQSTALERSGVWDP